MENCIELGHFAPTDLKTHYQFTGGTIFTAEIGGIFRRGAPNLLQRFSDFAG
jgi:hypothetical protein